MLKQYESNDFVSAHGGQDVRAIGFVEARDLKGTRIYMDQLDYMNNSQSSFLSALKTFVMCLLCLKLILWQIVIGPLEVSY